MSTNTALITATSTSTTTVTTTSTQTIATPAGFTPISQEAGYVAKRDTAGIDRSARLGRRDPAPQRRPPAPPGAAPRARTCRGSTCVFSPAVYPQVVSCINFLQTVTTRTASGPCAQRQTQTQTAAARSTTVSLSTTTTITTTAMPAAATTTVTTSSTIIQTTTSIVSATTTTTVTGIPP